MLWRGDLWAFTGAKAPRLDEADPLLLSRNAQESPGRRGGPYRGGAAARCAAWRTLASSGGSAVLLSRHLQLALLVPASPPLPISCNEGLPSLAVTRPTPHKPRHRTSRRTPPSTTSTHDDARATTCDHRHAPARHALAREEGDSRQDQRHPSAAQVARGLLRAGPRRRRSSAAVACPVRAASVDGLQPECPLC